MCRSKPQLTVANHLCCLTSLAPEPDPSRLCSSLIRSLRMADLHMLGDSQPISQYHKGSIADPPRHGRRLGECNIVLENVGKRRVAVRTLEWRRRELMQPSDTCSRLKDAGSTYDHLVHQDTKRPPVDRRGMSAPLDHLGRNIL
jgi:hypothetical protein